MGFDYSIYDAVTGNFVKLNKERVSDMDHKLFGPGGKESINPENIV